MHTVRSVFAQPGTTGDFSWMIDQPEYSDALMVFNDNEEQFREHHRLIDVPHACPPGGGNAAIRPYQCLLKPRAAGVPTGANGGYTTLDDRTRAVIDEAIAWIDTLLATGRYRSLVYSWDPVQQTLGTGIFRVGRDVTDYIADRLETSAAGAP